MILCEYMIYTTFGGMFSQLRVSILSEPVFFFFFGAAFPAKRVPRRIFPRGKTKRMLILGSLGQTALGFPVIHCDMWKP
jgi:hypothetical protein